MTGAGRASQHGGMDPWAELGVAPDAPRSEIRRAYLALARRFHPDVCADDPAAAERMRRVNQAWEQLTDPARRPPPGAGATSAAPATGQPFDSTDPTDPTAGSEHDPNWDDSSRDDDPAWDDPLSAGGLPDWLRLAPPAAFVSGSLLFIIGGLIGLLALVAVGITLLVASLLMFVIAALVALASSARTSSRGKSGKAG